MQEERLLPTQRCHVPYIVEFEKLCKASFVVCSGIIFFVFGMYVDCHYRVYGRRAQGSATGDQKAGRVFHCGHFQAQGHHGTFCERA